MYLTSYTPAISSNSRIFADFIMVSKSGVGVGEFSVEAGSVGGGFVG
jgi:hypothetical protein